MTMHTYSTPEFELLKEMSNKQDRLIERLFGDLDAENPKARFPAIEQHQLEHGKRLQRLENDRIRLITFTSVVSGAIGFLVELFIHGKL